jgi:hypothetical protein
MELMVVVALVAGIAVFLFDDLGGGGRTTALQSAQAEVANLIVAARTRALATGRPTRILVHIDPRGARQPARFLRCLVVQMAVPGDWENVVEVYLPGGVYVVPGNFDATPLPAGLFSDPAAPGWTRPDGAALRSTVLRDDSTHITLEAIGGAATERWANFSFTDAGTTGQSGDLVLTTGKRRPPGTYAEGESPIELDNPAAVRGVTLSAYGVPVLIDGHDSF